MASPPLSRVALAGRLGVSPSLVTAYAKRGMPTDSVVAARRWCRENIRPSTTGMNAPPEDGSESRGSALLEARTARERAEAELAQIKALEARGALVSREKVRQELARRLSGLREALLQIPSRLDAVLAAETDAARVHALLEDELYSALAGVSEVGS